MVGFPDSPLGLLIARTNRMNLLTFDAQKAAHKIAREHMIGGSYLKLAGRTYCDFDRRAAEIQARAEFEDSRAELVCQWLRMITAVEPQCAHESVTTADGHGAFCRFCSETLA
jgi:hypothetical protein